MMKPNSGDSALTLGDMVRQQIAEVTEEYASRRKELAGAAFTALGRTTTDWLRGEVKFVATGKVSVSGDPARTLVRCEGDGFVVSEMKELKGKSLDEVLEAFNTIIADLSYLFIRGAIAAQKLSYVPPDYEEVASLIDMDEVRRRFPEVGTVAEVGPTIVPIVIAAVDIVVLVIDAVRFRA